MIALLLVAQLTLTCEQVRAVYYQLGHDEFHRLAIQLGFTEAQMKEVRACIGARR